MDEIKFKISVEGAQAGQQQLDNFSASSERMGQSVARAGQQAATLGDSLNGLPSGLRNSVGEYQNLNSVADRFVSSLREQLATLGMSEEALLRHQAAEKNASSEANLLITRLIETKAALAAKADADAKAAAQARAHESELRSQKAAADRFIASLREMVATQDLSGAALLRYQAQQHGVIDKAEPLISKLKSTTQAMSGTTMSAGEMAMAMRILPMQITDIVTSLASGMPAWLVITQQGGQLKDMFGGITPAAKAVGTYVLGLINPLTLAAAAMGIMAVAAYQGAAESDEMSRAIALSGQAMGITADQALTIAAKTAQASSMSQSAVTDAVQQIVIAGGVTASQLGLAAQAAVALEQVGGQSIDKTAQQFAELGKEPLSGSLKLNESFRFLTVSVYEQIKAATDLGDKQGAAKIAQDAYAQASIKAASDVRESLGPLSKMWLTVTEASSKAWSAMMGAGRKDTIEDQVNSIKTRLKDWGDANPIYRSSPAAQREIANLESQLAILQAQASSKAAAAEADKKGKDAAIARAAWDQSMQSVSAKFLTSKERELRFEQQIAKIKSEGEKAGASPEQINSRIKQAKEEQNQSIGDSFSAAASIEAAKIQSSEALRQESYKRTAQVLQTSRQIGILSEEAYLSAKLANDESEISSHAKKIEQELALAKKKKNSDADQIRLIGELAQIESQRQTLKLNHELDLMEIESKRSKQDSDARASAIENAQRESGSLEDQLRTQQDANAVMGLTGRALADVTAQRLLDTAAQKDHMAAVLQELNADLAGEYLRQSAALRELAGAKRDAAAIQAAQDAAGRLGVKMGSPSLATPDMSSIRESLASIKSPLSSLMGTYADLITVQSEWGRQGAEIAKRMSGDESQRAKATKDLAILQARMASGQVAAYSTIVGAAKGLFKEHTAGYKIMEASEKGFRLLQLAQSAGVVPKLISDWMGLTVAKVAGDKTMAASSIESAATDVAASSASGTAAAAAGIAKQASAGDPYTALARMAVMAAAMAALGFATGSIGGGGGSSVDPGNLGTGTVLGDSGKQSESLSKSLDTLSAVDTMTMRYSAQMLDSLRSIDYSMSGLAALLSSSSAVNLENMGIQTGFQRDAVGNFISNANSAVASIGKVLMPGVVGDLLGGLTNAVGSIIGNLFGSKTSVTGQGLFVGSTTMGEVFANGVNANYYADTETKKKAFGITYSTSTDTQYQTADAEINRQLSLVLSNIGSTLTDSAGALADHLGISMDDVQSQLSSATLDIGKINLKDLSGQEIQEKLSAVFSSAADKVSLQAIPGLESFQQVGEGYFETLTRVATGTEQAQISLQSIGVEMIRLTDLSDKQAEISSELVRESIAAKEGLTGVGEIISLMDGSASDLTSAYQALNGVRQTLAGIGTTATDVTSALLAGAGGLQSLQDSLSNYKENFLTAEEQIYLDRQEMTRKFSALGYELPDSAAAFRDLVNGIDTSTESGQTLLGQVISLSDGMSDLANATKSWQSSIKDAQKTLEDAVNSAKYGDMTTAEQLGTLRSQYAAAVATAKTGSTDDRTAAAAKMAELLPKILDAAKDVGSVNYLALRDKLTAQADAVTSGLSALVAGGGSATSQAAITAALTTATKTQQASSGVTSSGTANAASFTVGTAMMAKFDELIAQVKELRKSIEQQGSGQVVDELERLGRALTRAVHDLQEAAVSGLDDTAKASISAGRAVVSVLEATR